MPPFDCFADCLACFLGDELVVSLPCHSNYSGWANIRVFNPHSLARSFQQKITAFLLSNSGTVHCPHLPYLACFCGGGWSGLIYQLLCFMHVDKHETNTSLALPCDLMILSRDVPAQTDTQIISLWSKTEQKASLNKVLSPKIKSRGKAGITGCPLWIKAYVTKCNGSREASKQK